MRGSSSLIQELLASPKHRVLRYYFSAVFFLVKVKCQERKINSTRIKRGKFHPVTLHEDSEGE